MLTANDIEFHQLDLNKVQVIFSVKNKKSVEEFMSNKELQEFLTNDYDGDGTKRGCRLTLDYNAEKATLTIGRQLRENTIKFAARNDLATSIIMFIYPPSPYNYYGLADMTNGLARKEGETGWTQSVTKDPEECYNDATKKLSDWSRAKKFALKAEWYSADKEANTKQENKAKP